MDSDGIPETIGKYLEKVNFENGKLKKNTEHVKSYNDTDLDQLNRFITLHRFR